MDKPPTRFEHKGKLLRKNLKNEVTLLREQHESTPLPSDKAAELFDLLDMSMGETEQYIANLAREALLHGVTKFQLYAGIALCRKAISEGGIDSRSIYRQEFAQELLKIMQVDENEQQH